MNRLISVLSVLAVFGLLLAGCPTKITVISASLGQEISLAAGQTVDISDEDMTVKFIEITEDSRCPEGATCIWAGQASASVELIKDNITSRMILTETSGSIGFSQSDFAQYILEFHISPYPKVDKPIDKANYRLLLKVEKIEAAIGQEISLVAGQTVEIIDEDMTVKFIEITEDSRCPEGTTCIWAGEASASIELTKDNVAYKMLLTEPGLSEGYDRTSFKQYMLTFRITPYPEADKPVGDTDYRLILTVNRN